MKIKSLLLGSAAAMAAVTTANAADIIIPEPEVVEYVRVCEAAGSGYFYIPGSEVCLRISGYVQYEMTFDDDDDGGIFIETDDTPFDVEDEDEVLELVNALGLDVDDLDDLDDDTLDALDDLFDDIEEDGGITVSSGRETFEKNYEARLQFDAWTDTAYGPLATRIRMTAGNNALGNSIDGNGPTAIEVDRAYFDLAGLRMGLDVSAWDYGFGGPADAYNNGGPVSGTVRYTATFGAGSFTLSLEEDSFADDFVPSIVGVASFNVGDFEAMIGAVYEDDSTEIGQAIEDIFGPLDEFGTAWGVKATGRYSFGVGSVGAGVQYSSAPAHSVLGLSSYMTDYEWVLGGDVAFDATEALELGLGFQYGIDEGLTGGDDDWIIGASASYDITETLNTNLRLRYDEDDDWSARIRFRSSF